MHIVSLNGHTISRQMHSIMGQSGKLIMSRDVIESITTDAGCFDHVGLCQLCTNVCTQLTKAYVAETSCISCYRFSYVSAHDQFAKY